MVRCGLDLNGGGLHGHDVHRKGQPGCVVHHTCHASVTHFRPILGNIVEVALMTSPNLYIISHAKGTYFPLARILTMIPPFHS